MKLLIVTGMSGAGKTRVLNALEDIGFFCIDNLPPGLLEDFTKFRNEMGRVSEKVAITIDSRSQNLFESINGILDELKAKGIEYSLLFIDCEDSTLLRRYKESRRNHPLMYFNPNINLQQAIAQERDLTDVIRSKSDYIVDSTHYHTSELKNKIIEIFGDGKTDKLKINFVSFGFKYGILNDADLIFDVRCLPNPYYVQGLRELTGENQEVVDYVMSTDDAQQLFSGIMNYLTVSVPMYVKEGKVQLVVGIGCTGGQHRSVTFARLLSEQFNNERCTNKVSHRDINRN